MLNAKKIFHRTPKTPPSKALDATIAEIHSELSGYTISDDEFEKGVDHLTKLYRAKAETYKPNVVSKDTMVIAGTNIVGILAILSFEQVRIVSTKALGLVLKVR